MGRSGRATRNNDGGAAAVAGNEASFGGGKQDAGDIVAQDASPRQTRKKKRKNRDDNDHSKEEESARTLLEMKGFPPNATSGDDEAQNNATLTAEAEKALGGLNQMNGSSLSSKKPSKEKRKNRREPVQANAVSEPTSYAPVDPGAEGFAFMGNSDSGAFYPIPSGQDDFGHGASAGYATHFGTGDNGYGDAAPYGNIGNPYVGLDHNPLSMGSPQRSKISGPDKKRKRRGEPSNVMTLENAAASAVQLIDPALTDGQWQMTDVHNGSAHPNMMDDEHSYQKQLLEADEVEESSRKRRRPSEDNRPAPRPRTRPSESDGKHGSSGTFTKEEVDAVQRFMEEFMANNNLSQRELNERVWAVTRKRDEFWNEVAKVLPNRERQSIYKFCRRKYHNFDARGKWTVEEDAELARLAEENPNKWKDIGKIMSRMPEDCRDRWRNYLKCGKERNTEVWSEQEEAAMREAIRECILEAKRRSKTSPEQMENTENDDDLINWTVVSEKMQGQRSRLQCLYKWKKLKKREEKEATDAATKQHHGNQPYVLDTPEDTGEKKTWRIRKAEANYGRMLLGDKMDIIQGIRQSGTYDERNIQWKNIAPESIWSSTDRKVAYNMMKRSVPDWESLDLQQIVAILHSRFDEAPEAELAAHYQPPTKSSHHHSSLTHNGANRSNIGSSGNGVQHLGSRSSAHDDDNVVDGEGEDDDDEEHSSSNAAILRGTGRATSRRGVGDGLLLDPQLQGHVQSQQKHQGHSSSFGDGGIGGPDDEGELRHRIELLRQA